MRLKTEVERGTDFVSRFLAGPSIEIWIGVFISIIAFYLVFKLSLSANCFAIRYRFPEIRDEVPEKVQNDRIFNPVRASHIR